MQKIFLSSSNACTPGPNTRATELVWQSARRSLSAMAGRSGSRRGPAMVPSMALFSSSRCPAMVRLRKNCAEMKIRTSSPCRNCEPKSSRGGCPYVRTPITYKSLLTSFARALLGMRSSGKERRFVMENRTTVLYVDDNPKSSRLLNSVLEECGFRVITKNDPVEALALCTRTYFDLALLDYEMPLMSGSQLAREIKFLVPDVPVVLISGRAALPATELTFVDAHFGFGTA